MKNPRSVDNTVDTVDNPLWITHTVFVNTDYAFVSFTHGKPLIFRNNLQDALQIKIVVTLWYDEIDIERRWYLEICSLLTRAVKAGVYARFWVY